MGILELSVAVGGLTGLCLQMLALVPPAGEPSGHRPSAPPTTPAASSGARRQSQVLLGGLLRREGGREGGTPRTRNYQQKLAKHPPKPRTAPIRAPRQNEQPVSVCRRAVWLNHLQPASHLLHQHWLWLWNIHRDIKQPLRNHQHRWEPLLVAEQCLCTEQAGWVWK